MFVRLVAPVAVKLPPVLTPNCSPVGAPLIVTVPAVTAALELTNTRPVVVALVTLTLPRFSVPVPVTVSRVIPLAAPLAETLWSTKPPPPMATPFRLSAVPVPEVTVLPVPVTPTVPPPVALKPMPVVVVTPSPPPLKLIVPPVFPVRLIAFAVVVFAVIAPPKVVVPPVLALMETAFAALFCWIVPLYVTFAVLVFSLNAAPVGFVIEVPLENVNVPLDPLTMLIPAAPPLRVVVPLKL